MAVILQTDLNTLYNKVRRVTPAPLLTLTRPRCIATRHHAVITLRRSVPT